jgi:hypothetical protein
MRRLIAAAESLAIDYGGISIVSRATGVSRREYPMKRVRHAGRKIGGRSQGRICMVLCPWKEKSGTLL